MKSDIVKQLKALRSIEPGEAWKAEEKGRLLARISAFDAENDAIFTVREIKEPGRGFGLSLRTFLSNRFAVAMASLAVLFTSGAYTVMAAQTSLPGDRLYAVKLAGEKIALAVASEEEKPKIEIEQAGKRLEELAKISQKTAEAGQDSKKVEELVAEFKAKVDSANAHLEELSAKGKTDTTVKVANVAKIISEQSEKYSTVLQQTTGTLPEPIKEKVANATVAVQKTNIKALLVMVESPEEKPISQEEIVAKVQTAVEKTEVKINEIAQQTATAAEIPDCAPAQKETAAAGGTETPAGAEEGASASICPVSGAATDIAKAEEAQKELEKAKENLKNNNLADTLKSVAAATEIAAQVEVIPAVQPAIAPNDGAENSAQGQPEGQPSETPAAQ
jgi:hypothetical protein